MMNARYMYLIVAAVIWIAAGCRQEPTPVLTATETSFNFAATGGEITFEVMSNVFWTVTGQPQWIRVSPSSGNGSIEVTIKVENNPDNTVRDGEFKIAATDAGLRDIPVSVIQAGSAPVISGFAPVSASFGGTVTISGDYFSTTPASNTVKFNGITATVTAASRNELKVTVPKNTACTGRITVTAGELTGTSGSTFTYMPTYTVSTLAGASTADLVEGNGTNARFRTPYGMMINAAGNIYVTDAGNHRIRMVTPAGVVSTFAGSGAGGFAEGFRTSAQFNFPSGIAQDAAGNIYVADNYNYRIRKINSMGMVSTLAGSGTGGFADGTGGAAQFLTPISVVVDAAGNVYVTDAVNNRIRKITPEGVVSTFAGSTGGFTDATGTAAQFSVPFGLAIDAAGNIYVADTGNCRIRKITPERVVSTIAGNEEPGFFDGKGTDAKFWLPIGIAVSATGVVYVADNYNHSIRMITPEGVVTTIAGNGTAGVANGVGAAAQFDQPIGVVIDAAGNLYVSEVHRIRKISIE